MQKRAGIVIFKLQNRVIIYFNNMLKNKRGKITWLIILICLAVGLLVGLNSAQASVICKKYKEHKREFKTEENKEIYLKIRWVKNHQEDVYSYYRPLCEPYKFDHDQFTGNLKEICHDYYIYEEYKDYLQYKKQCHEHDDEEDESEPQPPPIPM